MCTVQHNARLRVAEWGGILRRMLPFMLSGMLACTARNDSQSTEASDSASLPSPWEAWEGVPLDEPIPLVSVPLPQAVAAITVETIPSRSLSVVWDQKAAAAWVLDARYRHVPVDHCIPMDEWPELDNGHQRSCAKGYTHVQRGMLDLPTTLIDIAVDPVELRIAMLDANGNIWMANADMLQGNPLDVLREEQIATTVDATQLVFDDSGQLFAIADTALLYIDEDSASSTTAHTHTEPIRNALLWNGVVWIHSDTGLYRDGSAVENSAGVLALTGDGDGVAYTDGAQGEVVRLDDDGMPWERVSIPNLHGPITRDPTLDRLYVITDAGVEVVGEETVISGDFVDVAINAAQEVVALQPQSVAVFGDDHTLMPQSSPVSLMAATFVEKPRSTSNDAPCRGDDSVDEYASLAAQNAAILADLPTAVALGFTPHFARRAEECDAVNTLTPVFNLSRVAFGALFHERHGCVAEDVSCIADFLSSEAGEITDLGVPIDFSSGLSTQEGDWLEALVQAGLPDRYLFFGASILPSISAEGDPRAKDSWPLDARSVTWRADSTSDIEQRETSGAMVLLPGDNLPIFNLSACANLFLRECHMVGAGDGVDVEAEDIAVLTVLTRRAVIEQNGHAAWSFHLPDIGVYDYTGDCERSDEGIWSGDNCGGARLQNWAYTIHTRYVANGLAQWAGPTDVEAP